MSILFVCWLVGQRDFRKTTEQISAKIRRRMSLGPEQTLLSFGEVPDERDGGRISFLTS